MHYLRLKFATSVNYVEDETTNKYTKAPARTIRILGNKFEATQEVLT
jgi:hypothetical protein